MHRKPVKQSQFYYLYTQVIIVYLLLLFIAAGPAWAMYLSMSMSWLLGAFYALRVRKLWDQWERNGRYGNPTDRTVRIRSTIHDSGHSTTAERISDTIPFTD